MYITFKRKDILSKREYAEFLDTIRYNARIDDKGRFLIPKKFLREIGEDYRDILLKFGKSDDELIIKFIK